MYPLFQGLSFPHLVGRVIDLLVGQHGVLPQNRHRYEQRAGEGVRVCVRTYMISHASLVFSPDFSIRKCLLEGAGTTAEMRYAHAQRFSNRPDVLYLRN